MQGYPPTGTLIETPDTGRTSCCEPHRPSDIFSRSIRFALKVRDYWHILGARLGLRWFLTKVFVRLPGTGRHVTSIRPPALEHPVRVRMFPHSDDFVFDQVFIVREHAPLDGMEEPKFILDLGANVGYASALFASRYPRAKILAVEPDPGNFDLCSENLRPYGDRVRTLRGAVWGHKSRLALARGQFGDGRDWAIQVHEAANQREAEVEAWDVPALLKLAGEEYVDLAKIDIEGSEVEVFAENTEWLSRVRNICIELHGPRCEEIFFRALRGYDYDRVLHGENTLCLNLRRTQARGA